MAILTHAAALAIATKCVGTALAPIAVGIALHENPALDTEAVNHNRNGTIDHGLGQINDVNFGWLSRALHQPINAQTITDPCTNFKASLAVLFARYNGNPPDDVKAAYAEAAIRRVQAESPPAAVAVVSAPMPAAPPPCAPSWDGMALARCNARRAAAASSTPDSTKAPAGRVQLGLAGDLPQ